MARINQSMAIGLRALLAFALLSLALAHRAPALGAPDFGAPDFRASDFAGAVGSSAFLTMPDGSLASLCVTDDDGGSAAPRSHAAPLCEACLLAGATLVPRPDTESYLLTEFSALANPFAERKTNPIDGRATPPKSRGPPALS